MNIPLVIHTRDGRAVPVSVPESICALGQAMIAAWSGYRADQVSHIVRVS